MDSCATVSNKHEVIFSTIHDRLQVQFGSAVPTTCFRDNLKRDNVENFIVIGLFEMENDHAVQLKSQLQNSFNVTRLFSDADSAVIFMKTILQENIFFIISVSLLDPIVIPSVQHLSQLYAIYVICDEKEKHDLHWLKNYSKVKGVFSDISSVCESIIVYKREVEHSLIGLDIFGQYGSMSLETNNKQDGNFMCSQLFKELILQTEDQCREDIAMFARKYYTDNPQQLAYISEFENTYDPSEAITWYTRNTFLYRMVNKALRTQDHLVVYAFRLFIRNLHMKLNLLQAENKSINNKLVLYRGQSLTRDDFEKLKSNIGGLLSVNTFLSTSEKKDIALLFTGGTIEDSDTEGILFEIDISTNEVSSAPYANVDQFSAFQGTEKEYLFSMGTVFRIKSIDKISGSAVWNVRLSLTNHTDAQVENLNLYMRQGLQQCKTVLSKFTNLMQQMNFPEKALHFYMKNSDIEKNPIIEDITLKYLIGDLCLHANNYEGALNYYQKVLEDMNENMQEKPMFVCNLYNRIGNTYVKLGNLDLAHEFHQRAFDLALSLPEINQCQIAAHYIYQGDIVMEQNNMDAALIFYQKGLALLIAHLPSTHSSIAHTYSRIAHVYRQQEKIQEALEMFEKSLSVLVDSSAANHPSISATHRHISTLLWILARDEEALHHGLQALQIGANTLHVDDPQMKRRQDWVDFLRRDIHDHKCRLEENSHDWDQLLALIKGDVNTSS
ncbi:unnamed protein product [Rotaria socialis]|uniref:NAD(P)(+)--arginine ADP-ribosyltransferase n=3 Tax=Rotaria socialis TaxID=392032 RepID=A0A821PJQ3_9BILA|nr:unnamed protein product [Rotaria socialis]CAF4806269.1 unnamed protein product [Rotaria socialis]